MYQLQGYWRGVWSPEYISWDRFATDFATWDEARDEYNYWIEEGRDPNEIRIVEIG